jgi:hypothetical protein
VWRESWPDVGRDVRHGRFKASVCERLVVEGEMREGDVTPDCLPLPPLVIAEAPAAFLRPPVGEPSSPLVKVGKLSATVHDFSEKSCTVAESLRIIDRDRRRVAPKIAQLPKRPQEQPIVPIHHLHCMLNGILLA